jgi:hypothetical protein
MSTPRTWPAEQPLKNGVRAGVIARMCSVGGLAGEPEWPLASSGCRSPRQALIVMPRVDAGPDHYVLRCARQYAATLRTLRAEPSEEDRLRHARMLHYLIDAGRSEFEAERRGRIRRLSPEVQERIDNAKMPPIGRLITREEAELIRHACSVPPVTMMDSLNAEDMINLAEMYEGWAQDPRIGQLDMARLLGWADGMRALAEAAGPDYEPPPKVPGEPDPLMKFLANQMRQQAHHQPNSMSEAGDIRTAAHDQLSPSSAYPPETPSPAKRR